MWAACLVPMVGGVWSEKVRKNGWNGTSPNHLDRRARSGFSDLRRVGKRKRWKDHTTQGEQRMMRRETIRGALGFLVVTWLLMGQVAAQEAAPSGGQRKRPETLPEGAYNVRQGDTL